MNLAGAALDILDQRAESSGHLVQAVADKFEFVTGAKVDGHAEIAGSDSPRVRGKAIDAADRCVVQGNRHINVKQEDHNGYCDVDLHVTLCQLHPLLQQFFEIRQQTVEHFLVPLLDRRGGYREVDRRKRLVTPGEDVLIDQCVEFLGRCTHVLGRSVEYGL